MASAHASPGPAVAILLVDRDEGSRLTLQHLLESQGYAVGAAPDAASAVAAIAAATPDLLVLDVAGPDDEEAALCARLRVDPATAWLPVIVVTALPEETHGLRAGLADAVIHKPFQRAELISWVRALMRLRHVQLEAARMEGMLISIAALAEARSVYREDHLLRVSRYSRQLAEAIGLDARAMTTIRRAALLHDVGMITVPDAILRQPRALTPAEFRQVKKHAILGAELSRAVPDGHEVSLIVRSHHERWHGGGYPDGLEGEAIPVGARIVAVADAFDALTSRRPYRAAMSPTEALEVLWFGADDQWDPTLVEVLASLVQPRASRGTPFDPREIVTRFMALTPERP